MPFSRGVGGGLWDVDVCTSAFDRSLKNGAALRINTDTLAAHTWYITHTHKHTHKYGHGYTLFPHVALLPARQMVKIQIESSP